MERSELQQGLSAAQRQEEHSPQAAEQTLRRLLEQHPLEPLVLVQLARLLRRCGREVEAIPLLRQATQLEPKPSSFNDLGSLYLATGNTAAAIDAYRAALHLEPQYVLAGVNLADALSENGRVGEAIEIYRRMLSLDPKSVDGRMGLAVALLRVGENGQVICTCEGVLNEYPAYGPALHLMAIALGKAGSTEAAIAVERQVLALNPRFTKGWHALGNLLDDQGDAEGAAGAYQRALEIDPTLVEASFDLAAISGAPPPAAMPRPYVIRLFDDFATTFERRLVAELDYRVPEALRAAVAPFLSSPGREALDILDLGCGTGLVGKQFRDVARNMTGIDLSAGMLAQARAAGVYSQLLCDEVVHYLSTTEARFDLILAADLFIYIGDLEELFGGAAQVLRPAGLLAFSIETVEQAPFVLRRTRRYGHALQYIAELAGRHSLRPLEFKVETLRQGDDGPVQGQIVVLERGP